VRWEVIEALRRCGRTAEDTLAREEAERRRKATALLDDPAAAQRARAARELGLLCREEDQAPLLALLDDRDGVAAAAAARALGDCGASPAIPRLVALLGEGGEVAAAAAEALASLHATESARAQLRRLARSDGDEALAAAVALGRDCETAPRARSPRTAAALAAGCPPRIVERVVRQLLRRGETDAAIAQLALRAQVAGPALLEALRREQAAREKQIAGQKPPAAAEIATAGVPAAPEKERYAQLMARLRQRQGAQEARNSASTRLGQLLRDGGSDRRDFIAAALRASLALHAPGADQVAAAFAGDPDPAVASAARGEPEPEAPKTREAAPLDPRTALWSDDGAVRAQACSRVSSADETRRMLARADPELRVRIACARKDR
jgi:hypothetical protein